MSVRTLPHSGKNISISRKGNAVIFGWQAVEESVRPESQPDGSAWGDTPSTWGWQGVSRSYAVTIAAMISANKAKRPEGNRGNYRLEVPPEIAAHLRASDVYGRYALMCHVEGEEDGVSYVDIPLSHRNDTKTATDWRANGGVMWIRVSGTFTEIRLVEVEPID